MFALVFARQTQGEHKVRPYKRLPRVENALDTDLIDPSCWRMREVVAVVHGQVRSDGRAGREGELLMSHHAAGARLRDWLGSCYRIESLERRILLVAGDSLDFDQIHPAHEHGLLAERSYVPEGRFLFRAGGALSDKSRAAPLDTALDYIRRRAADLGISAADIGEPIVTDLYTDDDTGTTHVYLRQQLNGLPIANADLNITVLRDGRILSVGGTFLTGVAARAGDAIAPRLGVAAALGQAARGLGLSFTQAPTVLQPARGIDRATTLRAPQLSLDDIPAKLQYVATAGGPELAWQFILRTPDQMHWYDASVSADGGEMLFLADWVDGLSEGGPEMVNYTASFNVFPLPLVSPDSGPRQIVTDPWDLAASPLGWQDLNGMVGGDSNVTSGNNVAAQEDTDGNNIGGFRPSGGSLNPDGSGTLSFNFPVHFSLPPEASQNAAITNLYYWNNVLHDIHFKYGFTESAGNFQRFNYTGPGQPNDPVQADAQDGSGINNANMATPPDGSSPRMQMFLWNFVTPERDSSFDNGVIIHEYGHGVSNRLTGGPSNSNALNTIQSAGMGEGWSDWWALMLAQTDGSPAAQMAGYPIGTYVVGQPPDGPGIRRYPYSFDMNVNPQTFGQFMSSTEVHHTGEYWCSTLWDMNWLLMRKHGFNPDVSAGYSPGAAGNILALKLVMDALKIQPSNPTFIQARDAILAADTALTGGANLKEIWMAFARRGLGISTVNSSSSSSTITPAFDLPSSITSPVITRSTPYELLRFDPLSSFTFHFNESMNPASFSVLDDVVSFTGPGGIDLRPQISPAVVWGTGNRTLTISFTAQNTDGTYAMTIGPNITSADNLSPMDQDLDGMAGEVTEDAYTATVTLDQRPGPDGGGYLASLTTFENIDLVPGAAGVVSILTSGDDITTSIPLGSNTFRFYGTEYTGSAQLHVSDNGLITFGTPSAQFRNNNMTRDPNSPAIAVLWDDWATDHDSNDQVLYFFDNPNNRLIIEWNQVVNRGDFSPVFGTTNATFQAILKLNTGSANSDIVLNYPDLSVGPAGVEYGYTNGGSATVGIKNVGQQGPNRLLLSLFGWPQNWLADGKAVRVATTASVSGRTYIDANGNGVEDAGELPLGEQTIYHDANQNGILDTGENFTTSDGGGNYTLGGLPNGLVRIRQTTASGYVQTSPNVGLLNINPGDQVQNLKFGNFPLTYSGATSYVLRLDATQTKIEIFVNTDTTVSPAFTVDRTLVPSLSFTGSSGDNTLAIDMTSGDPLPGGGVTFNGLSHASGDVLRFDGSSAGDSIAVSGGSAATAVAAVAFSNVESIVIDGAGGNDTFTYTAPVAPAVQFIGGANDDTLTVNTTAGNSPSFNLGPGNDTLNVNGSGFVLGFDGNAGASNLTLNLNGSMTFSATQHLAALNIATGASAVLASGANRVLVTKSLVISGSGRLDLTNNDMIVDYTGASPIATVQSYLTSGYAAGAWNGNGIRSSTATTAGNTAIGFAQSSEIFSTFPTSFSGQSVDNTAVLLKYTFYGDADLGGGVNLQDFNRLASKFGQSPRRWVHGNFDFDNDVDLMDFNRLAGNFGSSGLAPAARSGAAGLFAGDEDTDEPLLPTEAS